MSDKIDKKHKIQELKEMLKERKPEEPVEKVLASILRTHMELSMDACRVYYEQLVKKGEIKEK